MNPFIKDVLLIASFVSLLCAPAQAQSAKQEEAEICYSAYYSANLFTTYYKDDLAPFYSAELNIPEDMREGEYDLRLYRSGKEIAHRNKIEGAAYERSIQIMLADVKNMIPARRQYITDIRSLKPTLQKCDVTFKIPTVVINTQPKDMVTGKECAVRYATMFTSMSKDPAQQQYFNTKASFAMEVEKFIFGADQNFTKEILIEAQLRAKQSFNADGNPKFDNVILALKATHNCDKKYGLPITPIPQALYDAASGKNSER